MSTAPNNTMITQNGLPNHPAQQQQPPITRPTLPTDSNLTMPSRPTTQPPPPVMNGGPHQNPLPGPSQQVTPHTSAPQGPVGGHRLPNSNVTPSTVGTGGMGAGCVVRQQSLPQAAPAATGGSSSHGPSTGSAVQTQNFDVST